VCNLRIDLEQEIPEHVSTPVNGRSNRARLLAVNASGWYVTVCRLGTASIPRPPWRSSSNFTTIFWKHGELRPAGAPAPRSQVPRGGPSNLLDDDKAPIHVANDRTDKARLVHSVPRGRAVLVRFDGLQRFRRLHFALAVRFPVACGFSVRGRFCGLLAGGFRCHDRI